MQLPENNKENWKLQMKLPCKFSTNPNNLSCLKIHLISRIKKLYGSDIKKLKVGIDKVAKCLEHKHSSQVNDLFQNSSDIEEYY